MPIKIRVDMIRHGQTDMNLHNIWYGHLEGQLTQLGIDQAKQAGIFIKNESYTKVFSSDLIRAKDTFD